MGQIVGSWGRGLVRRSSATALRLSRTAGCGLHRGEMARLQTRPRVRRKQHRSRRANRARTGAVVGA